MNILRKGRGSLLTRSEVLTTDNTDKLIKFSVLDSAAEMLLDLLKDLLTATTTD